MTTNGWGCYASDWTILNVSSLKMWWQAKEGHFYCKIVLISCSIDCIHFSHHHFLINPIVKYWGASPFFRAIWKRVIHARPLQNFQRLSPILKKPCGSSAFLAFIMRTGSKNAEILPLYVQLFRPLKKNNYFSAYVFWRCPFVLSANFRAKTQPWNAEKPEHIALDCSSLFLYITLVSV